MRRPPRSVLTLVAAVLALPLLPPLACTTPASRPAAAAVRIMPLGDSNTTGTVGGGYRTDLYQLLASDGEAPDFVGSNLGGPDSLPDKNHEGHGGWTIAQIDANAVAWLRTYRPDLVLLQIGTNDMKTEATAAGAPARLAALLDKMLDADPRVRILLATIPPIRDAARQRRVEAFNRAVASIAAGRDRVSYVDVYGAVVQPGDFGDAVHPTRAGYSKIALRWYAAITGRAEKPGR